MCAFVRRYPCRSLDVTAGDRPQAAAARLLNELFVVAADLLPDSHSERMNRLGEAILGAVGLPRDRAGTV